MGKTTGAKAKPPSKHSRAARRATSPSIDTDKSLKKAKPPTESVDFRPSVLAIHQGAGVTKKSKSMRKSAMSSKARKRHEKGMERAEVVMDRTAVKVQKSKGQAKKNQAVKKTWDEINAEMRTTASLRNGTGAQEDQRSDDDDDESQVTDEEMAQGGEPVTIAVGPPAVSLPPQDEDEEIM